MRKQLFTNINISLKRRKFDCDSFPGAAQMLKKTPRNLFWTDLQSFFGGRQTSVLFWDLHTVEKERLVKYKATFKHSASVMTRVDNGLLLLDN